MFRFLRTLARSLFRTDRPRTSPTASPTTIGQRIEAARSANLAAETFSRHTLR
jgi:hypothetical protein